MSDSLAANKAFGGRHASQVGIIDNYLTAGSQSRKDLTSGNKTGASNKVGLESFENRRRSQPNPR